MIWFLKAWGNTFNISGRARRKEYWYFVLFSLLSTKLLSALYPTRELDFELYHYLITFFQLVWLVPGLTVSIRRLHDIGKSGLWVLLWLVPVLGGIFLFFWFTQPGEEGKNYYGEDPLVESGEWEEPGSEQDENVTYV